MVGGTAGLRQVVGGVAPSSVPSSLLSPRPPKPTATAAHGHFGLPLADNVTPALLAIAPTPHSVIGDAHHPSMNLIRSLGGGGEPIPPSQKSHSSSGKMLVSRTPRLMALSVKMRAVGL